MAESAFPYTIVTGKYSATEKIVSDLLGQENTELKFRLYFHWHNVIHELGHLLLRLYASNRYTEPEQEELAVNRFAVAYWSDYGEPDKFEALSQLVKTTLPRFRSPAPEDMDYLTYARQNWGGKDLFTFNNYGWFQFSCVADALSGSRSLADVLKTMGIEAIQPQSKATLCYSLEDEEMALKVLDDATVILRTWGLALPDIPHILDDDPNRQCISTVGY